MPSRLFYFLMLGLLPYFATPMQPRGTTFANEPTEAPNIIFILTDDLGPDQIGAYGSEQIKTPNLDRMAKRGIRFTSAYAGNTVCSPSRVSLFTGRDSRLMKDNSNTAQLEAIDVTFAHILKRAGYETALFGKYSLGTQFGVNDPLSMGFDTWFGMNHILEGHRQYPSFLWRDGKKVRIRENEGGKKGAYAQQLFTDEAIKFIQQNKQRPFFVLLAYSSPHAELDVPAAFADPYQNKFDETPYLGMEEGKPSHKYAWYYPNVVEKPKATFAGMVSALDTYVGKIVDTLAQEGIDKNTLIVFTSDNGPHDEGGADPTFFNGPAPLRGIKRDLYEGGIRVPMIVTWPTSIKSGRRDDTPIVFADFLPTIAELSGVSLDTIPRVKTNGVSIAPRLNDSPAPLPERTLYWEFGKQAGDPNSGVVGNVFRAARKGKWKVVQPGSDASIELFDLEADPGETKVLNQKYPDVLRQFETLFANPVKTPASAKPHPSSSNAMLIRPPAGRLAIVVDGNSPDPDDIGATAVMLGILHAASLNDRLVHLSHSCDLQPAAKISRQDEKRRQDKLQSVCDEGVQLFGPFQNLRRSFNCRTEQADAIEDLKSKINASTQQNPLWIIEAGEPDVIGFALEAAKPSKRKFVNVITHHEANDNSGHFYTWKQILALGVSEHRIADQNIRLQTLTRKWDWAKETQNAGVRWIRKQLAYAERDGVVRFQTNKFDCSDAGMVYWWITGAKRGGDETATPETLARLFLR